MCVCVCVQVVRTASLTHWACCLDLAPDNPLIAIGIKGEWKAFTRYQRTPPLVNCWLLPSEESDSVLHLLQVPTNSWIFCKVTFIFCVCTDLYGTRVTALSLCCASLGERKPLYFVQEVFLFVYVDPCASRVRLWPCAFDWQSCATAASMNRGATSSDFYRAQELCQSGGVRPGLPIPNSSCGLCGHKATLEEDQIFGNQVLLKEPSKLWLLCLQSASWSWWITTKAASRTLPHTTIPSLWPASRLTALSSSPLHTDSC